MASKPRVLIVDDSRPVVTLLKVVLEREGYEVVTAYNGDDGLRIAREQKPDLIVLDIMMPGMDGYEVCYRLKQDYLTADIPILMLTGKGNVEEEPGWKKDFAMRLRERLKGFDAGATDFMSKPVSVKKFLREVKALLWFGGRERSPLMTRE
ncbi:MAG: response regulator [Anaerolineae bacterium]|nr:response regulator [Anaerolineae bacterium]